MGRGGGVGSWIFPQPIFMRNTAVCSLVRSFQLASSGGATLTVCYAHEKPLTEKLRYQLSVPLAVCAA